MYGFRDIYVYVMYYVYVTSGPSLLIESTDYDKAHHRFINMLLHSDSLESLTYTVKEVNAVGRKTAFNKIAPCHPFHLGLVEDVFKKAFGTHETMFIADKTCKRKGMYMCNIILCLFSLV